MDKTKIIVHRKGGYLSRAEKWHMNGEEITVLNNYKYLGYTLTTKLSGDDALSEYVGRAKNKVLSIFRTLKILGRMDFDVFFKLFDSQVAPSLTYAGEIWGMVPYENIEAVHLFACKRLLGVRKKTPNCLVYGELGRYPLSINTKIQVVKYWFKILNMSDDRLPKLAYMRELTEENKIGSWCNGIKTLLQQVGFGYVWEDPRCIVESTFIKDLKLRLKDTYQQFWADTCDMSSKFTEYRSFKTDFIREPYLKILDISKFRLAYTRIRTGANYLNANRRFIHKNPFTKCPFCPETETEFHLLIICPKYKDLREKYVYKHFREEICRNITLDKLINNDKEEIIRDIAVFTHQAFNRRFHCLQALKIRTN